MNILLFAGLFVCAYGRSGVDLSVATTVSDWECLVNQYNVSYSFIRVYRSVGAIDTNSATNIKNAASVGIHDIGIYMFPCLSSSPYSISHGISCASAEEQVTQIVRYLHKNNIPIQHTNAQMNDKVAINRIWLDIEDAQPSTYYNADVKINQAFIDEIVNTLNKLHIPIGIYTTKTYWQDIMGNVNGYGQYPLWYPRYDNVESLDFFSPFADFTKVDIKQTAGNSGRCLISQVDNDYRED